MEIKKVALAGTLESSDVQVTVEPSDKGVNLSLESSVMNQYGQQIKETVLETLDRLGVKNIKINVIDKGALDCTIKARVECAVLRACEVSDKNIAWGGMIKGFKEEVIQNRKMGFDGKSIISPKHIRFVHETFAPTPKEIAYAEKLINSFNEQADSGIGVYTVDGKMVDLPFFEDARRIIALAKACGVYQGKFYMEGKYVKKSCS